MLKRSKGDSPKALAKVLPFRNEKRSNHSGIDCQPYLAWLQEWIQRGRRPSSQEAVAWFLVQAHAKQCSFCSHGVAFLVGRMAEEDAKTINERHEPLNASVEKKLARGCMERGVGDED